jgi:hypothetical protein
MVADLEVVEPMTNGFARTVRKESALRWCCIARQAERSTHFGRESKSHWIEMRQYYAGDRTARLEAAAAELRGLIPDRPELLEEPAERGAFRQAAIVAARYVLNRFRTRWRFPSIELAFLEATLRSAFDAIALSERPSDELLTRLRMRLCRCQFLIESRMVGVSGFREAARIEHFCQPLHMRMLTWDEIMSLDVSSTVVKGLDLQRR